MSHIYRIHVLPTSEPQLLPFLAGKFASLRLSALTVSASAFSSTFEIESKLTASDWITRLQRPSTHFLIAVAYPPDTEPELQTIDAGDWVGSATLLGPIEKQSYVLPESGGPETGEDDVETKWQMTAVFNTPFHRGKGIAKKLINGALELAAEESGKERASKVRIIVHPSNTVVLGIYEGLGFVNAGRCTLAEAYICNGDANLLPSDGGASNPHKYLERMGIVMEKKSPSSG